MKKNAQELAYGGGGFRDGDISLWEISYSYSHSHFYGPRGGIVFSKFEDSGCTATKRKVCLGPGIGILVMQEPPGGKKSWKHAKFPAQFSGPCAK